MLNDNSAMHTSPSNEYYCSAKVRVLFQTTKLIRIYFLRSKVFSLDNKNISDFILYCTRLFVPLHPLNENPY